jgi:UDP-glucose 4-epimerase
VSAVDLHGGRVLITGGAGFIGSHIADAALAAGAGRVVVIDDMTRGRPANLAAAARTGRIECHEGDVRDRRLVDRLTAGADIVFHQAALRITHCAEEPARAIEVMANGTQYIVDAAARRGVAKVVSASSASVYGEPSYLPMDEAHPLNSGTLYGDLKVAGERLLERYAESAGLRYAVGRPFNVYGPRMDVHGAYTEVMIRWLANLARGEPPVIFGDGSQTMDFIAVADVARAYILAAVSEEDAVTVNIGTGRETSLRELAALLCAATGREGMEPVFGPARKVNGVTRRRAAVKTARERIGFEAQITLREGLAELVGWYQALDGEARC